MLPRLYYDQQTKISALQELSYYGCNNPSRLHQLLQFVLSTYTTVQLLHIITLVNTCHTERAPVCNSMILRGSRPT